MDKPAGLFHFHVELQWMRPLLERLVQAVERIAGPLPDDSALLNRRKSTLDDYVRIPEDEQGRMLVEQEAFARSQMLVPGSDAFLVAVEAYERQILESYGDETGSILVAQLPWKAQSKV